MSKIHIKKNDTVQVLSGEDRGKQGRVLMVDRKKERAIVEGLNIITKACKPSAAHPQGGLIKMEAPIRLCKLALLDPKSGKPTRIGLRKDENGKTVRYSKKSGEVIK
ncbi:MAG: 50S ribosomal protein L24 [Muribaculaceae bacterium]|nr:50S ribosomal protein L24 [Muribaculaceae bacterium]